MGNKEKTTTNQKIKQTMKFASIIAIAAVLSFSAEAQRNGDSDRDGERDGGRGGRGRGRIPAASETVMVPLLAAELERALMVLLVEDSCTKTKEKILLFAPLTSMFTPKTSTTAWTQ